jgi:hypothetical protein
MRCPPVWVKTLYAAASEGRVAASIRQFDRRLNQCGKPIAWRVAPPFCFLPVPELWVPRPCVLCKGGYDAVCTGLFLMPRLRRYKHLWFPPFANNAKDGAPAVLVVSARSKTGPPSAHARPS